MRVMAQGSFFVQSREDALRHLNLLTQGLKRLAIPGLISGLGCGLMGLLLRRFLTFSPSGASGDGGFTSIAWFLATVLVVVSIIYLILAWALARHNRWARYAAASTFALKILLCVWLGLASFSTLLILLLFSSIDVYGLWVLLSQETGLLFSSPEASQASGKPANLVT
jgi:hypothetical protein